MDKKISIHSPSISQNSTTGEPILTMTTFAATRWANVRINSGTEVFADDERHVRKEITVTMRYLSGVLTTMKVLYPSSGSTATCYYDITGIEDVDERHTELIITAEKYD